MNHFHDSDFFAPAFKIAQRIREGNVSAREVVEALIHRIRALNPKLNAFVNLGLEDALQAALKQAEMLDGVRKENPGMKFPPLFGVPVAVKDDLSVEGMPFTCGSQLFRDQRGKYDDLFVKRLREAGAIILGKTCVPEFAHKGTTDNQLGNDGTTLTTVTPWDLTRTSGGSSGGSGSAVAAGLAYLASGSDVGGSIRIPASCCGVVGFKPSFGVIPRVPSGNAFSLWVTGPMTRTVEDACLAMSFLAEPHPGDRFCYRLSENDPFSLSKPLPDRFKIAWYPNPSGDPVEPEVEQACLEAVQIWAKNRAEIVFPSKPFFSPDESNRFANHLARSFVAGFMHELLPVLGLASIEEFIQLSPQFSPSFRSLVSESAQVDLTQYIAAQVAITTFCETSAEERFAGCDVIISPTIACLPPSKELELGPNTINGHSIDPHLNWTFTWPFNLTGEPAISIPVVWNDKGLPIGLQIIGRRGQDSLVLQTAASFEKVLPWNQRIPSLGSRDLF